MEANAASQQPTADASAVAQKGNAPAVASPPKNMREGDWMCQSCNNHNYATRQHCNKCQCRRVDAPEDSRPGDWRCRGCGGNNYKSKTHCFKCREPKSGNTMMMANFRPGDWMCPGCGNHNYAQRDSCNKCHIPRMQAMQAQAIAVQQPQGPLLPPHARPGDWMCNSCGNHNFASREQCNKCKGPKTVSPGGVGVAAPGGYGAQSGWSQATMWGPYGGTAMAQPVMMGMSPGNSGGVRSGDRPGDWKCASCNYHNYANRTSCKRCSAAKGDATATPAEPSAVTGAATNMW